MPLALTEFKENVYAVVRNIPQGYVLSYGRISVLAGRPQNARLVGTILAGCPSDVPAHRVVTSTGRTAPGWANQTLLLQAEGVGLQQNGRVDMGRYLWR